MTDGELRRQNLLFFIHACECAGAEQPTRAKQDASNSPEQSAVPSDTSVLPAMQVQNAIHGAKRR